MNRNSYENVILGDTRALSIEDNETEQSPPTHAVAAGSSDVEHSSSVDSVYTSSAFEINCDPCGTEGDYVEAVGYCSDCSEYYCKSCYRVHSRSKLTKTHSLMDKSTMPKISTTFADVNAQLDINKGSDTDDSHYLEEFKYVKDIGVKCPDDEIDCIIARMTAVSSNEIVIIDQENKSAKMIDVVGDAITSSIKFDTRPYDLTTIPSKEVAITFHSQRLIKILSTTGGLSVKRSIKLLSKCLAIACFNDKLYVAYEGPVKFQILGLSGGVRKTITPDSNFLQYCKYPHCIAVSPDEKRLYVCHWKSQIVLCVDMNGITLAVYKDEGLEKSHTITTTPFGSIYVCDRIQSAIYKMSDDLSEAVVILGPQDGLVDTNAICFCSGRQTMLVSSLSRRCQNIIKQYDYK